MANFTSIASDAVRVRRAADDEVEDLAEVVVRMAKECSRLEKRLQDAESAIVQLQSKR